MRGTHRVLESARKLLGTAWGDEETSRLQPAWTADPDLIRQQDVGQVCYMRWGGGRVRADRATPPGPAPAARRPHLRHRPAAGRASPTRHRAGDPALARRP
jgi:hypothetical protein